MCCELSFKALSGNVYAQKAEPWNDPLVNNINRNEPVSDFFGYENKELSDRNDKTLSKRFLSIEKYMLPYQDYAFKFVIRPITLK